MQIIRDIEKALDWFQKKKIIIFPTETVYGLGAIGDCDKDVREIFRIKNRPAANPLIIHFNSIEQIEEYAYLNNLEKDILFHYSPGPITLLLKKKDESKFKLATHNSTYICARIPGGSFARELINRFGPIAAPSANLSGQLTITNEEMLRVAYEPFSIGAYVDDDLIGGIESTICKVEENNIVILRKGFIDSMALEKFGPVTYSVASAVPGARFSHYQIRKPLVISNKKTPNCFHISMGVNHCDFNMSPNNNINEVQKNYFYSLFLGDKSHYNQVSMMEFPNETKFDSLRERLEKTLNNKKSLE